MGQARQDSSAQEKWAVYTSEMMKDTCKPKTGSVFKNSIIFQSWDFIRVHGPAKKNIWHFLIQSLEGHFLIVFQGLLNSKIFNDIKFLKFNNPIKLFLTLYLKSFYCHITNYPKIYWLKTTVWLFFMVSAGWLGSVGDLSAP